MVNLGVQDAVNWTTVEKEAASSFGATRAHVVELRQFLVSGEVIVRERLVVVAAEPAAAPDERPAMNNGAKLSPHHLPSLCHWVDRQRSEGSTVTNSKAHDFLPVTFEIEVTQRSDGRCFSRLGLSWQRMQK
jgi:hypothetical protein